MDYYSILGVERSASADDIKRAYRKLAMKHHPDRGGDAEQFKKISEAYETLNDPQKKSQYDNQNNNPFSRQANSFEFNFNSDNIDDVFSQFFGTRSRYNTPQKNRDIKVAVSITLEDVLTGREIDASVSSASGEKVVTIKIPKGVRHRQQIRFAGLGEDHILSAPPGNLIVEVHIQPHPRFHYEGDTLLLIETLPVWDLILGTKLRIKTLANKTIEIVIPAGTQVGTTFACAGEGLPNLNTENKGRLLVRVDTKIPLDLTDEQRRLVEQLQKSS